MIIKMEEKLYINKIENGLLYYGEDGSKTMPISNKVNPRYIKSGMSDVSIEDGVATFIKMIKNVPQNGSNVPQNGSNVPQSGNESQFRTPKAIVKQFCVDQAIEIAKIDNTTEFIDILENAKSIFEWTNQ